MVEDVDFGGTAEELERRFGEGVDRSWSDEDFNALALRAFRGQFRLMPSYRAFCEARARTPDVVERWQDVPMVPARAFKHLAFAVAAPEVVFLTSGTTEGVEGRGRHLVPRQSLYRRSLLPPFERYVLAGSPGPMPFLSLIPSPEALPASSLSFMVGAAQTAFSSRTHWLVDATGSLDEVELRGAIHGAAERGEPVLLLGTALALLHAIEPLEAQPTPPLPAGSRIMETGGFKGSGREVDRGALYDRIASATGVPRECIVSEYGMTELLSQLYDPILVDGPDGGGVYAAPPWLKVRTLDPVTLEEVAPGASGLLAFFDLANAGSVCHILTEDTGSVSEGLVRLEGRMRGAEPRGCSRAMDQLMSAAGSAS